MLAASLPTFARRLCVNSKVLTWVSNSATVGRFLRLAAADSRQIDRWQWKCADRQMISNYVYELSKASRLRVGGCVLFDMSRAKIKGKTGVQCSSERTQNLPVFIRSGFPQIASAAHLQRCYVVSHLFRQNKRVSSSFTIIHLSHNHVSSEWPPIGSTVFCCCFFALFFPLLLFLRWSYFVFTHLSDESYRRWFRFSELCLCDVVQPPISSLCLLALRCVFCFCLI